MFSRLRSLIRALLTRPSIESDMSDEIRFHLETRTQDLIRSGIPEEEARRRARLEFGSIESYKEGCRQSLGLRLLDEATSDLKYTARAFRRSPSFAIVAIFTLALGIGANAGLFTAIDTFVFRPIPVRDPWSLFQVEGRNESGILPEFSYAEYSILRDKCEPFQDMIADSQTGGNTPTGLMGGYLVSGNYFEALGIQTCLGRPITPDDETSPSRQFSSLAIQPGSAGTALTPASSAARLSWPVAHLPLLVLPTRILHRSISWSATFGRLYPLERSWTERGTRLSISHRTNGSASSGA